MTLASLNDSFNSQLLQSGNVCDHPAHPTSHLTLTSDLPSTIDRHRTTNCLTFSIMYRHLSFLLTTAILAALTSTTTSFPPPIYTDRPVASSPVTESVSMARPAPSGDIFLHDTSGVVYENTSRLYFTFASGMKNDPLIAVRQSTDGYHWQAGPAFLTVMPEWVRLKVPNTEPGFWAPDIAYFNGWWHLYYAISSGGSQHSCIALAVTQRLDSADPLFGWKDAGPVTCSTDALPYNCIDPPRVHQPERRHGMDELGLVLERTVRTAAAGLPCRVHPRRPARQHRTPRRRDTSHRGIVGTAVAQQHPTRHVRSLAVRRLGVLLSWPQLHIRHSRRSQHYRPGWTLPRSSRRGHGEGRRDRLPRHGAERWAADRAGADWVSVGWAGRNGWATE